jgi:hypothetical protein
MSTITVSVQPVKDYPALIMTWQKFAHPKDIRQAYRTISEALDVATSPIYVIVDLRDNMQMPLKETVTGAVFGPYNHRNLAAWFVIGTHQIARAVAGSLSQITRQHRVEWFDTEEQVYELMQELIAAKS